MTTKEAINYGGYKVIKTATILLVIMEIIFMVNETKGDFANGILFFITGQLNSYFILLIAFSFSTLYLLGRQAAFTIIEKNKNYLKVGFLFGLISTLLLIVYLTIAVLLFNESRSPGYNQTYKSEIAKMMFRTSLLLFLSMISIWLYTVRQIKVKSLN